MVLIVRLAPNGICAGCGAHGHTEVKTLLCCACLGLKIAVEERRKKVTSTLAGRFAYLKAKIQSQLAEFQR